MKSPYTNSKFYSNENGVALLEKLGLYHQCFDYRSIPKAKNWPYELEFWTEWDNFEYTNNKSIYLPFTIYLCDKIVPIVFNDNYEK